MDPMSVLKSVWQHKVLVIPALLLTLAAVLYVFEFAPRTYQSTTSFAVVNPNVPSGKEIEENPSLGDLNTNNPYLRSSDPSLITQALVTRLNAAPTAKKLVDAGLGNEYSVSKPAGSNGFVLDITGTGKTPDETVATTEMLGTVLTDELQALQTIDGADERYQFTPVLLAAPNEPQEQFSSRLRSLIVVGLGGVVLMFAAVSLGRSLEAMKQSRGRRRDQVEEAGSRRWMRRRYQAEKSQST
jgi:capsular polysaccharide biosynthesis protein